jgi:hypothetical protein
MDKVVVVAERGCDGLEELAQKREAEVGEMQDEVDELETGLRSTIDHVE